MTTRFGITLATGLFAAACTGDKPAVPASQAPDAAADQAAIDKIHADYITHFNLHHASAVADLHSDSAGFFGADGSADMGKAAIMKGLEETLAAKPTLTLTSAATKIFGDQAMARGSYTISMTPPGGAAINLAGNYLTAFRRENGAWKIGGVVTNYDAPPPAGTPRDTTMTAPPPDAGTMKALTAAYVEHYNLGHASEVAKLYTDSAYSAFGDAPAKEGRAAIEAYVAEQIAQGSPQLTIHDVSTTELPGGWAIDGGWFEITAKGPNGPVNQVGVYMLLAQRQADNSWKIHWAVNNSGPQPAQAK